jgi:glycerophosphoryl diester phosphodiesterase
LFHLQGHRGARGIHPENTLPSFEAAFDAGVTSIETDLHLTRDGVLVLYHDPFLEDTLLSRLPLAELRRYCAGRNPDPLRFPDQRPLVTPLAAEFAQRHGLHPYGIPTLAELLQFAAEYAAARGTRPVWFDLELKRVPFHPETMGDGFDGAKPGLLEERLVEEVRRGDVAARTVVRSFDHRCVGLLRRMEPLLTGAILIAETRPVAVAELLERADAAIYCPDYRFVDAEIVRQVHAAGARVLPWTVNEPEHWQRLLDWGVDGVTTDYPDRLGNYLRERGIKY